MANIIDEILKQVPDSDENISDCVFEGANIVLYTKNKDFYFNSNGSIKKIVDDIKKRIELRPDPSITMDQEKAKSIIEKLIPPEAGVTNIIFDSQRSIVIIEAEKLGLAIGKQGDILKEIKKQTLWVPLISRTPTIRSKIIENIRYVLYENDDFRRKFLHKVGKRIYEGWKRDKKDEWIRISFLGAARQVGRSCFLLQTQESRILLDCGIDPAGNDSNMFPHFDAPEFNINDLDAVIISHPHLDHSAMLPYLYKMGYDGPVYMTEPCRDIAALLGLDMINIAQKDAKNPLFGSTDIKNMVKHAICLDYEEVSDITPDVRLTFYNAGHTLGSALVHLHIGNGLHNLLYSLDGSTKVTLLDDNNNPQFVEIGKFIDGLFDKREGILIDNGFVQEIPNTKGFGTVVFNPKTLKSEIVNITSFVRHPINEDVYEIKTESGRSIKVTKSHSIFVAREGKIVPEKVSNLDKGSFIVGAKKIPVLYREPLVDLLPYLGKLRISVDDETACNLIKKYEVDFIKLQNNDTAIAKDVLFSYYKGLYKEQIAKKLKIHPRRVRRILGLFGVKFQPRVKTALPDKLRITSDLARFLGYYVSEGHCRTRSQSISIANNNIDILEDCYNIIKKEFGIKGDIRYKNNVVLFHSKQLKYLFCNILGCGKNAHEKRAPKELLLSHKEVTSNFLYGLFSGDGGIRIRKKSREINYGSKSSGLIQDISFMLLQFGLVPRLVFNKYSRMYNLHIYNGEKIKVFLEEVGINNRQCNQLLSALELKFNKGSFDMRIPFSAFSLKAQGSMPKALWRNAETRGIVNLDYEDLSNDDICILNSDLMFDRIKSIEKVKPTGKYVYDFRIDDYENFLGGDGFLFMHNTGDFLYEDTHLLYRASVSFPRLETVIMESTYGGKMNIGTTRQESEEQLLEIITKTIERGGKVLMPVLGVGRSQEIMLIIEKAIREGRLQKMPVYVQGMVWDITAIHTTYPDFFNPKIRKSIFHKDHNPFLSDIFKYVGSPKEQHDVIDSNEPCVIIATSGMMEGGSIVEYFKQLAENKNHSIVFSSYLSPGTLGAKILSGEKEINFGNMERQDIVKVNLEIYAMTGFSGHSNRNQLMNWVRHLEPSPKKIIVVHGESSRAIDLASSIHKQFKIETVAPRNLEAIRLR